MKNGMKFAGIGALVLFIAVGALAIFSGEQATSATIGVPKGGVLIAGEPRGVDGSSGIENIYIVKATVTDFEVNFGTNTGDVLGVITESTGIANISYETAFVIVVAVGGHADDMAYVVKENLQVELKALGSFSITQENSIDANEYVFDSNATWIRVNAVWDNSAAGYTLAAGGSISLDPVKLWTWS